MSDSLEPHGLQYARFPHLLEFAQFMSIELMMSSNHLIICRPLLLLPSIFPSIGVFSSKSALCIRWPKYWSFSFSPSNEYSELMSLGLTGLFSLLSKGFSRVFSSTTPWKHQFFGAYEYIPIRIESWVLKRCLYNMFLAALSTIVKRWKQPKCLLMGEWI